MGGGLLQLASRSYMDEYLTQNPVFSYFKFVYKKHGNFSTEPMIQNIEGNKKFGNTIYIKFYRNTDLINKVYFEIDLPDLPVTANNQPGWVHNVGHYFFKSIELIIGGMLIDKHYPDWFNIYSELSIPKEKINGYNNMINHTDVDGGNGFVVGKKLYLPLIFFFNKSFQNSLPIVALQYHDICLKCEINELPNLVTSYANTSSLIDTNININCYADMVYLDKYERKKYYFNKHLYNIEQLQIRKFYIDRKVHQFNISLKNHIKEIIIIAKKDENNLGDYSFNTNNPFHSIKLLLNGIPRTEQTHSMYYHLIQNFCYHRNIPLNFIHTYSFALDPEDIINTGSCNMSSIDIIKLLITMNDNFGTGELWVIGVSINQLEIKNGLADLKF